METQAMDGRKYLQITYPEYVKNYNPATAKTTQLKNSKGLE